MKRIVTIFSPKVGLSSIPVESKSPYEMVDKARSIWKENLTGTDDIYSNIEIADIVPIHNSSGIRDPGQITQMREGISAGKEIHERDSFPNIKLVVDPNGKLLLFDGTHSLLAYFHEGKKKLKEVPFLVISDENGKAVTSQEIAYFFPEDERNRVIEDWQKYVVNWQAEKGKQVEIREVESIGQLASQLGERNESSVEH